MKILHIVDAMCPGSYGVPEEYGREMAEKGHDVSIFGGTFDAKDSGHYDYKQISLRLFPMRRSIFHRVRMTFQTVLAEREWLGSHDVVFLHHPVSGLFYKFLARSRNQKVFSFFHSPWEEEYAIEKGLRPDSCSLGKYLRHLVQKRTLVHSNEIICLSEFMAERMSKYFGLNATIVPGGVDLNRFKPCEDKMAIRKQMGFPREKTIILTIRRLVPRMGLENLIEAYKQIHLAFPETHLVIGGSGPLKETLHRKVDEAGLSAHATLTGFIKNEDLPLVYGMADLFVLPTLALEGFGIVLIEAMACGIPVLSTPCGGPQEILSQFEEPGINLLFDDTSPQAIAEGMRRYLSLGRENREGLGRKSLNVVRKKYDLVRVVGNIMSLVEKA